MLNSTPVVPKIWILKYAQRWNFSDVLEESSILVFEMQEQELAYKTLVLLFLTRTISSKRETKWNGFKTWKY